MTAAVENSNILFLFFRPVRLAVPSEIEKMQTLSFTRTHNRNDIIEITSIWVIKSPTFMIDTAS